MWRKIILGLLFLGFGFLLHARDFPEKSNTYTIYINYDEYSVRANVLFDAQRIHPKIDHTYYWYADNDIKNTEGGFDGKLLHGEFKSFYRNKNLREQGNFIKGLKDGKWKTWFLNGKLHEIANYKNGFKQGTEEVYDEEGNMVSKTNFRNGFRNGKMVSYKNGNVDTTIVYRNGKPMPENLPKPNGKLKKEKRKITTENDSTKSGEPQDKKTQPDKTGFRLKNIFNKKDSQKSDHVAKEKKEKNPDIKDKGKETKSPEEKKKKSKKKNAPTKDQSSTKKT